MNRWLSVLTSLLFTAPLGAESVERLNSALDDLISPEAEVETLCSGFTWVEGPAWDQANQRLLFSDVPENTVYQWKEGDKEASVFLRPSGFTGNDREGESGSNGLAFDAEGRLLSCEHGDRRVSVLTEKCGKLTLADRYDGRRFNSPNDLTVHSSGAIYFTDPPYGLPRSSREDYREINFQGVYRIDRDGDVTLVVKNLQRPNGIALSPDESILYVAQSDSSAPKIFAYPLGQDGSAQGGRTFFDTSGLEGPGHPDGMEVHPSGAVFATGPDGVLIIDDTGSLIGRISCGRPTANLAFDDGYENLYITSQDRILRLPLVKPDAADS